MKEVVSVVVSIIALVISILTVWLTQWRRGNLRMTRPVMVGFLYELPIDEPKIFIRSLLFATGKRGHIVEAMFLKVRRGETSQTFDFWMYGEMQSPIVGSGLRVTEDGVASNHHFLPPKGSGFYFEAGQYLIDVYARIMLRSALVLLHTIKVTLTEDQALALTDKKSWVHFTCGAVSEEYRANVDSSANLLGPS
jgi:hypothetical protein